MKGKGLSTDLKIHFFLRLLKEQFDYFTNLDPDPPNFVDPDTINSNPHHWFYLF